MSFLAPFVAFGDASERDTMMGLYGMPKLHSLGPSTMGELCFNTELPSIGLICGAHNEEITNVLRRLIDSDPEMEVLVLHTDNSAVSDIICALATPESRIYVSPRNPERAFRLYRAVGQEALPLSFDCSEVALKHVLAFFSPREEGVYEKEIRNHIQHVVSQLDESFDLQRLNELVGKEEWSGSGESFIALRQTIFTMMVSSGGRNSAPSYAQREIIVDLTDHILSDTGLDGVLMDMVLKRFLETGAPQKMVVFNNASDFMGSKSAISRSLESLATLGSGRAASIIIATTDPQLLPLKILNSLDYVVSGPNRSSLSREFLEKHFTESEITRDKPQDRRMLIWSPNSLAFGNDAEFDEEGFGKSWDRTLAYARFDFFNRSGLNPVKEHRVGEEYVRSMSAMSEKWFQPAEPSTPHSSSMDMSQEDGMVPIPEYLRADATLDGRRPSTSNSSRTREFKAAEDTESKLLEGREINNTRAPVVDETRSNARPTQPPPSTPSFAGGSSSNGGGTNLNKPGEHSHLIKALLKAGNGQVGIWVDFEAVRKLVGNNTEVKALGFPSYTSMVREARDKNIIEQRSNGNDSPSIRLPPPSSAPRSRNKPPDSREKSRVAQSARPPGTLNINDLSQMMKSKPTPPPGINTDSIKGLASTSKATSKSSPGTQKHEGSSRTPITNPPSSTTQKILVDNYPEAHRPVVTAMQNLINDGNLGTEVALGPLHGELRRMGFTKANQDPPNMVTAASIARVVRCFRDKGGRRIAVLEKPEMSRISRP